MTDKPAAVRASPPPPGLMRIINPLVRRVLTTRPLASGIGKIALVELRGRRTGRVLRIPMGLHVIDGVPTAFTARQWRLNFAGGARVTVTHRGQPRPATAVLVASEPGRVGSALRAALDSGASPFDLGLKIRNGHHSSAAELDTAGLSMIQFQFAETENRCTRSESDPTSASSPTS